MASIRNSIHLQDRMTPVFRSIIKSMDSTLKVMRNLDSQANKGVQSKAYKRAEKDIKNANNQLIKMKNYGDKANNSMSKLAGSAAKVSSNMRSMGSGGINLLNLSAALYLMKNIASTIKSIMQAPDEALSTQARLGLFNESKHSKEDLYDQVYKTAIETRTGVQETGDLVTRILISGSMEGEGSALGAIKVTELINKSLIAGGGTAEENRRALLQLSQALASGFLQGDELRAIREQTPYLAKILAEGLEKVDDKFIGTTIGDLKELGGAGELTSDRIIKAFLAMEIPINEAFKLMPKTFGQAMTQINTVWKYFLMMLHMGDGALAKINEKAWQLADFLSSDAGTGFISSVAAGFTMLVDVVLWFVDMTVLAFTWLSQHMDLVSSAFIGIGIVAAGAAIVAFSAWVMAAWPILLVFAVVTMLAYAFIAMGYTAGDVIGFIIGGILALASIIGNIIVFTIGLFAVAIGLVWNAFISLFAFLANSFTFIGLAIANTWLTMGQAASVAASGVVTVMQGMANIVLGILQGIAKGIDFIFGTNLAAGVGKWISGANGLAGMVLDKIDPANLQILKDDMWKNAPWVTGDKFKMDTAAMGDGILNFGLTDPTAGWNKGKDIGKGFDKYMNGLDISTSIGKIPDLLSKFDTSTIGMPSRDAGDTGKKGTKGANPTGGKLDKVDKIGSDVNIADEDLKLLRDMAAKDFLLNLAQITPSANITFGDVRETADINKILAAIEELVENAFATTLIPN